MKILMILKKMQNKEVEIMKAMMKVVVLVQEMIQ